MSKYSDNELRKYDKQHICVTFVDGTITDGVFTATSEEGLYHIIPMSASNTVPRMFFSLRDIYAEDIECMERI